jgi:N-acetylglutamate synthase-like GNAT family acetyltransferase
MIEIVKSEINDSEVLTAITKKSKAYWGYSDYQIEKWSDVLTITKTYIEVNDVYKLVKDDLIIGYYSYFNLSKDLVKLDNLFLLPNFIGTGLGKMLINDFFERINNSEIKKIVLESEPKVEKFYEKFGFNTVAQQKTSLKNRYLPIMEKTVNDTI